MSSVTGADPSSVFRDTAVSTADSLTVADAVPIPAVMVHPTTVPNQDCIRTGWLTKSSA